MSTINLELQQLIRGLGGAGAGSGPSSSIYIATGVMAGVVAVIVLMLIVMIYRSEILDTQIFFCRMKYFSIQKNCVKNIFDSKNISYKYC